LKVLKPQAEQVIDKLKIDAYEVMVKNQAKLAKTNNKKAEPEVEIRNVKVEPIRQEATVPAPEKPAFVQQRTHDRGYGR
jgi:hypothetical protein